MHDALWLLPGNSHAPANLLKLAFDAHGLPPPRDIIPCQSIAIALAIMAESDAVGIFVRALFDHQLMPRPLRMVPLAHELPAARVSILTRADSPPTPAAQCFVDCLMAARPRPAA
ncbi:HTH-type transcriptional regulator GbpR [compost metagenome]